MRSMRLMPLFAVLAAAPAGAVPLQNSHVLDAAFDAKLRVACSAGIDDISARIEIGGLRADQIRQLGPSLRAGPYLIAVRHELGDAMVGIVDGPAGVVRCQVISADRKQRVVIGAPDRRELLKDLLRSLRLPLPVASDPDTRRVVDVVERAIAAGQYDDALRRLAGLRQHGQLRDLAALRSADVHVLAGRIPTAYVKYRTLPESVTSRGVQLLALARSAELGHIVDGAAPSRVLVGTLARPTEPLGDLARSRVIRLLTEHGDLEQALALARVQPQAGDQVARLLWPVMRRLLRQGKAFEAALAFLKSERLLQPSPLRTEALLLAGQSYMDLDLPGDAAEVLQQGLASTTDERTTERILAGLVAAYHQANKYYQARQTADYYLARYAESPRLDEVLEARAALRLWEGDVSGAREDLDRLAARRPGAGAPLRRLLQIRASAPAGADAGPSPADAGAARPAGREAGP